MGSRIRERPSKLFELFVEVIGPPDGGESWILQKFPDEFEDEGVLKNVPLFCFPNSVASYGPVQHFCFVMTNIDGSFSFGFCRLSSDQKNCLCILSHLPWQDVFYKLLNCIVDLMTKNPSDDLLGFLQAAYRTEVPKGGEELHIIYKLNKVEFRAWCPDSHKLPSIPENRAVTEYYNALDVNNMITIFSSLLNERRVIITSKKLGRLTACVMAADILLYPMHWQHIFVTVLPKKLLDYLTAPIPYIIGVPSDLMPMALALDLGEVVIVDADENKIQTPFNDVQDIPSSVISTIKTASGKMFGDGVARAFMRALVELIGGYRFGLSLPSGEKISFDMEKFIRNRPANVQVFLSKLVDQQIFRQFIDERLKLLNEGEGFADEFEAEVSLLIDHESDHSKSGSIATEYRRWSTKGGNLLKSVTNKMRDKSKEAVKGLRVKMQDVNTKDGFDSYSLPPDSPVPRRLHSINRSTNSLSDRQDSPTGIERRRPSIPVLVNEFTAMDTVGATADQGSAFELDHFQDLTLHHRNAAGVKEDSLIDFDDKRNHLEDSLLDLLGPHENPAPKADDALSSLYQAGPATSSQFQRPGAPSPWSPPWNVHTQPRAPFSFATLPRNPVVLARPGFPMYNLTLPANWNANQGLPAAGVNLLNGTLRPRSSLPAHATPTPGHKPSLNNIKQNEWENFE